MNLTPEKHKEGHDRAVQFVHNRLFPRVTELGKKNEELNENELVGLYNQWVDENPGQGLNFSLIDGVVTNMDFKASKAVSLGEYVENLDLIRATSDALDKINIPGLDYFLETGQSPPSQE